ncbi:hypothetical protein HKD37_U058205 [Glycine soja]
MTTGAPCSPPPPSSRDKHKPRRFRRQGTANLLSAYSLVPMTGPAESNPVNSIEVFEPKVVSCPKPLGSEGTSCSGCHTSLTPQRKHVINVAALGGCMPDLPRAPASWLVGNLGSWPTSAVDKMVDEPTPRDQSRASRSSLTHRRPFRVARTLPNETSGQSGYPGLSLSISISMEEKKSNKDSLSNSK